MCQGRIKLLNIANHTYVYVQMSQRVYRVKSFRRGGIEICWKISTYIFDVYKTPQQK